MSHYISACSSPRTHILFFILILHSYILTFLHLLITPNDEWWIYLPLLINIVKQTTVTSLHTINSRSSIQILEDTYTRDFTQPMLEEAEENMSIMVYLAAIFAWHISLEGKNYLVIVLEAKLATHLSHLTTCMKVSSLKVSLLFTLATAKHVNIIHALNIICALLVCSWLLVILPLYQRLLAHAHQWTL